MPSVARGVRPSPLGRLQAALSPGEWRSVGTMAAVVVGLHGLCGPYTKNPTGRRRPPGLKRLGTAPLDGGQRGSGGLGQPLTTSGFVIATVVKIISGPNRPICRRPLSAFS